MMKKFLTLLAATALSPMLLLAEPQYYPFEITLAGAKAVMKEGNDRFAEIAEPVTEKSVLLLDGEASSLVVNAYRCREDGSVDLSNEPDATWAGVKKKELSFSRTLSGHIPRPGLYLALVNRDGKTARIAFRFETAESKDKDKGPVDFSKLRDFLRKQETPK